MSISPTRSPTRVLDSEDLMYGHILPYLPLEAAQALACCCSEKVRNAVLWAITGAQAPHLPTLRRRLLTNSVLLNAIPLGLQQIRTFTSSHFHQNQTPPVPHSKFLTEIGLSQASTQALQATRKEPIEEVLPSIAEEGDLDLLEGALTALNQKPISQSTVDLLFSICTKAIQKNQKNVAQRLLTAIANSNTLPAVLIKWDAILATASGKGHADLVQDILQKSAARGTLTDLSAACTAASEHNHVGIMQTLCLASLAKSPQLDDVKNALDIALEKKHCQIINVILAAAAPQLSSQNEWDKCLKKVSERGLLDSVDWTLRNGTVTGVGLQEAFTSAALKGQLPVMQRLLQTGGLTQQALDDALKEAVLNNNSTVVRFLLQTPALGGITQRGLDAAAQNAGNFGRVKNLKIMLSTKKAGGLTRKGLYETLRSANINNQRQCIKACLAHKKMTPSMYSDFFSSFARNLDVELVKLLLRKGVVSQSSLDKAFKQLPNPYHEYYFPASAADPFYATTLELLQTTAGGGLSQTALDDICSDPQKKPLSMLVKKIIRENHIIRFQQPLTLRTKITTCYERLYEKNWDVTIALSDPASTLKTFEHNHPITMGCAKASILAIGAFFASRDPKLMDYSTAVIHTVSNVAIPVLKGWLSQLGVI